MNVIEMSAKTKEEALNQVLAKLNASEAEVIYSFTETKGGLFKGNSYLCKVFLKLDLIVDVQEFLKNIVKGMGIDVSMEVSTKEGVTTIKMYSSNNPVLIGKNGQNLEAMTVLCRQYINNVANNGPKIILDVED